MAKNSNNNYVNIEDIKAKNNNEYQDIEKIVSKQGNLLYNKYKETEDTLPINFKGKGKDLKNYRIYGNTVNGESVGDRTANLIQGSIKNANIGNNGKINTSNEFILVYAPVVTGESYTISNNNGTNVYAFYNAVPSTETATSYDSNRQIFSTSTITFVSPTTGYIAVRLANTAQDIMINPGSTAVPYEPVGYRVPVTVTNGTDTETTNIYLPEPIKMVGDEAEYIDYETQKQHRVRKNLLSKITATYSGNGILLISESDGTVSVNGIATETVFLRLKSDVSYPFDTILSGCAQGGSREGYYLRAQSALQTLYSDFGNGALIPANTQVFIEIRIQKGAECNNLEFKPMIRKADIEDDTYEPYIENTEVDVTLPALPTLPGTNTLTVGTEVQPSSVYLKGKLKRTIYGWHVDPDISDSSNAVTYLKDAIGMIPASMGSSTFNYGSWQNAFFMPKPCMLKSNGKVDYYLDPNDYTKKLDGTASDISNPNYDGNAMMQWPKIWFKYVKGAKEGQGYFYVANYKADGNFHCWCNYDSEDNEIDHFYTAIYNGTSFANYSSSKTYVINDFAIYDNKLYKCNTDIATAQEFDSAKWNVVSNTAPAINKMRSLSGIRLTGNNGNAQTNTTTEVTRAEANNTTIAKEWYIETFSDRLLINGLLVLMGKSLNTQAAFGRGLDSDASLLAKEAYITGTLNDKGLFYGVIGDGQSNGKSAVKVFGMENFWGCVFHRTAGLITDNHVIKLKLTYGTKDGSTVVGYNQTGNGYIDNGISPFDNGYIQKMSYNKYGFIPAVVTEENQSTYYADYCYEDASYTGISYALFGGSGSGPGSRKGAFSLFQRGDPEYTSRHVAASLSCKPISLFN